VKEELNGILVDKDKDLKEINQTMGRIKSGAGCWKQ
jgi:hypothetical protein